MTGEIWDPNDVRKARLKEVEYVGFLVVEHGVRPTGKMLRAIQEIPRPQSTNTFTCTQELQVAFKMAGIR